MSGTEPDWVLMMKTFAADIVDSKSLVICQAQM
jgi:hypothetical protein